MMDLLREKILIKVPMQQFQIIDNNIWQQFDVWINNVFKRRNKQETTVRHF